MTIDEQAKFIEQLESICNDLHIAITDESFEKLEQVEQQIKWHKYKLGAANDVKYQY